MAEKPKYVPVDPDLHAELKAEAKQRDMRLYGYVRRLLEVARKLPLDMSAPKK